MGRIHKHLPVKLFSAITYHQSFDTQSLFSLMKLKFSEIEIKSESYNFSAFTDYYKNEMGEELRKLFIVFASLIDPVELPSIKLETNKVETELLEGANRQVNIDPGYITQAKLVLATTKNYSHRIYLGEGIFGDLHMQFSKGSFIPQPWTYPDYRQKNMIEFFNRVRQRYLEQLDYN